MLSLAAACFAAGVLVSPGGAAAAALPVGLVLLLLGRGRAAERRSERLVAAAVGLRPEEPPTHRDRVLAAAGFGVPRRRPAAARRIAAVCLGAALCGTGWAAGASGDVPPGLRGPLLAVAASDVRRWEWGWGLQVELQRDRTGSPAGVRVWAADAGDAPRVEAGDRLVVDGRLVELGGEGFDDYLRSLGVEARLRPSSIRIVGPTTNPLLRLANAARAGLRSGARAAMEPRHSELFLGLAIGDVERMDPEVDEDFRASGLGHLLAVSGSNVAMFLVPLLAVGAGIGLRMRGRVALGLAGVLVFAMITRWEPSVLRASAMAAIALAASWSGRPRSTAQALGAAVILLLVAEPSLARSLGFQLSVAATVGLAALAAPLAASLRWLPRWIALTVAATVAAQAAVTPLLLLHFGVVPLVTVLANVLAFPAVAPALFLAIVASAVASVSLPIGRFLGEVAGIPLGYLVEVADTTARFTLPSLTGSGVLAPAAVAAGVALLALGLRRGRRGGLGVVVAAAVIGTAAWVLAPSAGPPAGMTVTFLDVGQGDAAVVRGPGGETILIDTGPEEQQAAAELAALGVRRVDLAVASHGHADHIEGFPAVLSRFPVSLMVEPGCPADSPAYRDLVASVRDEDVRVEHPRGGDRYRVGSIRIEVLGPDACSPEEPNDDSLILLVRHGRASVLFPGDAEVPAQRDLLLDGDPIGATVLKVPHHGGDTSDEAFLGAIGAGVAVVSTGENDYGHPNPGLLRVLQAAGMVVYRTDLHGDVTVRFDASGVAIVME